MRDSLYAAVTATYIKNLAEKGLLSHVQFIRELLVTGVLKTLLWIDTRDMSGDGLTKGSVDRMLLHQLMNGYQKYQREHKVWSSRITKTLMP